MAIIMRSCKYMKIDFLRSRKYAWVLLIPLATILMLICTSDTHPLFGATYFLFVGIIFSSFPFYYENEEEMGFLQMLPSRPGEQVIGHFVFAFLAVMLSFLGSMFTIAAARILNPSFELLTAKGMPCRELYWILLGAALLVTAMEGCLLTIFRFDNIRMMQLFRIAPGFLFFFAANTLSDTEQGTSFLNAAAKFAQIGGVPIFLICVFLFAAIAYGSSRIRK